MDEYKRGTAGNPEPTIYTMTASLLDEGRSNTPLSHTGNMWATLKVYASGGENGLHAHTNEDHTFVVLSGSAKYHGKNGEIGEVGPLQGIMIPAHAYYWFEATSSEPLVMLRIGSRTGTQDPSGRININGEAMPGDSPENKQGPVRVREGAFFGPSP
jgi:hypothetical protein